MSKKIGQIVLLLIAGIFVAESLGVFISHASGEQVAFGSESYNWALDTDSPIGIHISSEQLITYGEVEVVYNEQMLEYSSGGEYLEPGRIKIAVGDGTLQTYSTMLQFIPRVAGNTSITILKGTIQTNTGEIHETTKTSIPVSIEVPDDCKLTAIHIDDNELAAFKSDVTEYSLEVQNSVEKVTVAATAANPTSKIQVSDTTLSEGENTINIIVTNGTGNSARYLMHITRKEGAKVDTEVQEVNKPTVIQEASRSGGLSGKVILVAVEVFLVLLLVVLMYIAVRMFGKKRKSVRTHGEVEENKEVDDLSIPEDFEQVESFPLYDQREIEIAINHVTIEFKREKDESTSIKELLIRSVKKQRKISKFRALDDVTFNVKKGDVLGIIGTNGSGKSTLLKIIAGALKPAEGTVEVDRSKIQLLTLGTGFDYELTGRENVYLNGAIIGYTKEFIDEKFDDIVEFAELEGFMDQKVRNYSSGMVSRLAFAIATIRDIPEILILDEVLSVGDMFFRKKSSAKIKEMMKAGSTVLIVSHSTSVIRENCTRAVWIEKGVLKSIGNPADVCRAYEKMNG